MGIRIASTTGFLKGGATSDNFIAAIATLETNFVQN